MEPAPLRPCGLSQGPHRGGILRASSRAPSPYSAGGLTDARTLRTHDAGALQRERHRALSSANPFNAGGVITALEMDSYMPFPFLPPAQAATHDAVYEFRTYKLKPGGLPPTLAGWEAAIAPARDYTAQLMINMYAPDGRPGSSTSGGSTASHSAHRCEAQAVRTDRNISALPRSRTEFLQWRRTLPRAPKLKPP